MFSNKAAANNCRAKKAGLSSVTSRRCEASLWQSTVAKEGQSLIELTLAIAIAAIFLAALATTVIAAREAFARSGKSLEANLLLQKEAEAVRSVRESGWNSIANPGIYHTEQETPPNYGWKAVPNSITEGNFTRSFTVENVCRSAPTTAPLDCSNPTAKTDPSTKKITVNISWAGFGSRGVSSTFYISRYFGNAAWVQTTVADFNAGTKTNTVVTNKAGGEVELNPTSSTADYGNRFLITTTPDAIGNMTSQTMRTALRFTAQSSKTVNAIRVHLQSEVGNSPTYRYGIQADAGGLPSGTYLGSGTLAATSTGWQTVILSPTVTITAGTTYHIVVQWNLGTVNNKNYIALRRSNPLNSIYPFSNVPDTSANTLFNNGSSWTVQDYQPIYELDLSDSSYEGNPYETSTEVAIFDTNFIGEKFRFTDANKTAISASFYVSKQGNPPNPLNIVLQDIGTGQTYTCSIQSSQVSTSYTYQSCIFNPSAALTQNSNYRIYLRTTGGSSNKSYRVYHIDTSNANNYQSITYDGANSVYTASTNSGSSWTDTNYSDIGGFRLTIQTTGLTTEGFFESQTFDCTIPTPPATTICGGGSAGYNFITMTFAEPAGTNVQLQIAANNTCAAPWNFAGPDGISTSYFDNSGAIFLSQGAGKCFRFKARLTGDGTKTPALLDAILNYSP